MDTKGRRQQGATQVWQRDERPWFQHWPAHLPRSLEYPDVPATWILERDLDRRSKWIAIRYLDHQSGAERTALTYGEIDQAARRIAACLSRLGVQASDRIAFYLPNCPALVAAYFGTWLAGAIGVPCNPMYKAGELRYVLTNSRTSVVITSEDLFDVVGAVVRDLGLGTLIVSEVADQLTEIPVSPSALHALSESLSDVALILYTGGTTGDPKGAMLTHRNLVANAHQFGIWYGFEEGMETCVSVLPLSHSGGMAGVMTVPVLFGGALLLFQRFNPVVVAQTIERYRATRFFGVPTMYIGLLNSEAARSSDLRSLRACRTNAASLPPAVKVAFDQLVGHEVLVEGYGLTESSPLTHANPCHRAKAGSIGIPLPDTDATIVDVETGSTVTAGQQGELLLRGPQVMRGYWRKAAETSAALAGGWLHTGDIAVMDDDGYFRIVDRKKDVIITGGYKVWPREIEDVLYEHPAVALSAVVGIPDDYRGETVKACVVLRPGQADRVTAADLVAHCQERLANYKVPRVVEFRPNLPVSAAGKVLRRELRTAAGPAQE